MDVLVGRLSGSHFDPVYNQYGTGVHERVFEAMDVINIPRALCHLSSSLHIWGAL